MAIITRVEYVNTQIAHVTTTQDHTTRVYTLKVQDATRLYPNLNVDEAVSRMARKLFKDDNDSTWFTGYD